MIDKSFFDIQHDRRGTDAMKYDIHPRGLSYPDILPMWVADMDFKVPPAVEEALVKASRHGIFGYTDGGKEYNDAVTGWYKRRMNFDVDASWIIKAPGVVFSFAAAINALSEKGDAVIIFQPVYYPFAKVVEGNERKLVVSELVLKDGKYEMDFSDFEQKIIENNVKIFLMCSPHNPVGRVWTRTELERVAEICLKHNVLVIADEIHSDFIHAPHIHTPFATLSKEVSNITVTCTAPSKTFNIAGLQGANIFVENEELRKKVAASVLKTGFGELNTMAVASTKAAYLYGEEWLDTLLSYLQNNIDTVASALEGEERVKLIYPEGMYLIWLDCRGLNMTDEELNTFFLEKAGLYLNQGRVFGKGGSGFMRMNLGCPNSTVEEAMKRLKKALSELA